MAGHPRPQHQGLHPKVQIQADEFYSAYPNTTVRQIRKGQRVLKAWEEMLDASEE